MAACRRAVGLRDGTRVGHAARSATRGDRGFRRARRGGHRPLPDLFAAAGYDHKDVEARIQAVFAQLFHGDRDTQTVYYEDGRNEHGPLAYIHDVNSNDVRSEGMSYGMMIAMQLDRKAEFDAIWNWAMSHMYHSDPAHPAHGYFALVGAHRRRGQRRDAGAGRRGVLHHRAVLRRAALG